jgi:hypothetical protein
MAANLADPGTPRNTSRHARRGIACVDPLGNFHKSMASAALAWKRSPSAVYWDVKFERHGWRPAEPADLPAAPSA